MEEILQIVLDALSQFLETVLVGVLPILASLVTAWLIAVVKKAWQESKLASIVSAEQLASIAKMAVLAAEQLGLNKVIDDKKDYAVEVVQAYVAKLGLKVNMESILAAVEAAVMEEFHKE